MNKTKFKFVVLIEYAWLVMAAFCLIVGIYYQSKIGLSKVWLIYSMSVVSVGMFGVRRMQRKNLEKRNRRKID
ncbi:MAG: hypothetical protein PHH30_04360 [Bacteroidales bacterium]|nr:hypothetical protein [Bacteroidales bacterium]MDD3859292.1 hypothetical protein [Bacteroidales bacterium]